MPLIETKGAASAQGFGEFAQSGAVNYIEDVFSTYLYTGNGSTQTITNGIDLSTKGGLVWIKERTNVNYHVLTDTARGVNSQIFSNRTNAATSYTISVTSFNSSGFSIGDFSFTNTSNENYASWTFRKQPKFFDVVTYTGNGGTQQNIPHNLKAFPGCIFVKRTDAAGDWYVAPIMLPNWNNDYLVLNSTAAKVSSVDIWQGTSGTSSTTFGVRDGSTVNISGATYVAYLFAASGSGGFGLSGSDNVISCGSMTSTGSLQQVTLGYEPQWVMIKNATSTGNWEMADVMRGMYVDDDGVVLRANSSAAEIGPFTSGVPGPTATGFQFAGASGDTYIYIAIRRGPMKVPTSGTSVFGANARSGTGANATVTGGQIADAALIKNRGSAVGDLFASRLTGTGYLETSSTAAEVAAGTTILQANPWDVMDGVKVGTTSTITNASGNTFINYLFKRAPSFFDVVCYTGTGASNTISHNLNVTPELIIIKSRGNSSFWDVYCQYAPSPTTKFLSLESTNGSSNVGLTWISSINSSSFTLGAWDDVNSPVGYNYVAYLFATCASVSKVGSYTGSGTTKQIDCGFTGGARFVLIKRTDSTGDWYVWDTARGIVSGNDPYLLLNSTAAEVTSTDYIDTYSAGFEISSTAPAAINANGGTFIFLAIA